MKVQCDGMVVFHVDIRVSVADMAAWEPRRIYAFFEGIAKVRAAIAANEQKEERTATK